MCFSSYSDAREDKIIFIRAQFPDKNFPLSEVDWLNHLKDIQSKNQSYWVRNSYGIMSGFDVIYTTALTLNNNSTHYQDIRDNENTSAATFTFAEDARTAATAAGYDLTQYDHIIMSYPGIGIIAGGAVATRGNIWLPGQLPYTGLIHEFGHSLGVAHAASLEGNPDTVIYPGNHREGRDGLYMMGSEGGVSTEERGSINPSMRQDMGFLPEEYTPMAKEEAIYRIWDQDLDVLPPNPINISVRVKAGTEIFWLGYSPKMTERWADYNSQGFQNGLIVHWAPANTTVTRLLDFTPGSYITTDDNERDYKDTRDGALVIGQSYQFPDSSVKITPLKTGTKNGIKYIDVKISGELDSNFAYEPFDYSSGESLEQLNGGNGWLNAWTQTSANGNASVSSSGLSYPGLPVSGKAINLQTSTDTPSLRFARNTKAELGNSGTETWTSFLFRPNTRAVGHIFLQTNSLAVGKNWPTRIAIDNTTSSTEVQNGQTYFIVTRSLNINGNDQVHLWINPSISSEPTLETADIVETSKDMREGNTITINNSGYGQGNYDIDEIRVGNSWAAISTWIEDLSIIPTESNIPSPTIGQPSLSTIGEPFFPITFQASPNYIYQLEVSNDILQWTPLSEWTHIEVDISQSLSIPYPSNNQETKKFWRINRQLLIATQPNNPSTLKHSVDFRTKASKPAVALDQLKLWSCSPNCKH